MDPTLPHLGQCGCCAAPSCITEIEMLLGTRHTHEGSRVAGDVAPNAPGTSARKSGRRVIRVDYARLNRRATSARPTAPHRVDTF